MLDTVLIAMFLALGVLLVFHALMFSLLAFGQVRGTPDRKLPISIVICARNEAHHLQELIPLLMDQDHEELEVVVVNDRSQDDTAEVLEWMRPKFPRLRAVNIQADEKFNYGKKIALGVGVREARYDRVLVTDADCRPVGRDWVSLMASGFAKGRTIVLGHSPYRRSHGITDLLERYDGLSKAVLYVSAAKAGLPYMGVGRNLAYTKETFFQARGKGPRKHDQLMSGDDDLFINQVAKGRSTAVMVDPASFMETDGTPGLSMWFRRKRRHYTTARYYRFGHKIMLMVFPLARSVFWASLATLGLLGAWWEFILGLSVKLVLFLPVMLRAMYRLGADRSILLAALPLEWLFLVLDPIIYFSTMVMKPRRWK
ncbi:MAG: glycosyltransferase [Flavobacteriales bacterium]|nr:glycosyltransferase [Flavobacteriales bacterium]